MSAYASFCDSLADTRVQPASKASNYRGGYRAPVGISGAHIPEVMVAEIGGFTASRVFDRFGGGWIGGVFQILFVSGEKP